MSQSTGGRPYGGTSLSVCWQIQSKREHFLFSHKRAHVNDITSRIPCKLFPLLEKFSCLKFASDFSPRSGRSMVIMPEQEALQLERLNDGIVQPKVWEGGMFESSCCNGAVWL